MSTQRVPFLIASDGHLTAGHLTRHLTWMLSEHTESYVDNYYKPFPCGLSFRVPKRVPPGTMRSIMLNNKFRTGVKACFLFIKIQFVESPRALRIRYDLTLCFDRRGSVMGVKHSRQSIFSWRNGLFGHIEWRDG